MIFILFLLYHDSVTFNMSRFCFVSFYILCVFPGDEFVGLHSDGVVSTDMCYQYGFIMVSRVCVMFVSMNWYWHKYMLSNVQ